MQSQHRKGAAMSWSFPIARLFGSEIRIHVTFLLLLAWIAISHYQQGGAPAAVQGVVFILALFACVVAHEFGHALAARRYGIRTPDITLLPIGGLARLERMPEKSGQEIVVALAGPAVNVVIFAVLFLIMNARFDMEALQRLDNPTLGFMARIASVNLFLALFNLIPAFPMDGGRVLRAVLALWYPRTQATNIAARIGQALAFVFGFVGLIGGNPLLIFIAIFVYLAATAEAQSVGLQDISRNLGIGDAMITRFETLGPQATIADAAELLLRTTQHEFPVVDGGGRLRGMLTRNAMVQALSKSGPATPVLEAMTANIPTVRAGSRLEPALQLMQGGGAGAVGVADADGRLVGYITPENIGELMMVQTAGRGHAPRRATGPLLPQ
jgi:Zn-dependent protease/CBS domain-containing protein